MIWVIGCLKYAVWIFAGTLGFVHRFVGIEGLTICGLIHNAFPDFTNCVKDVVTEGDKSFARLTYTWGTHQGEISDYCPRIRRLSMPEQPCSL